MSNELLAPIVPPLVAEITTPIPTVLRVTEPDHWPFENVTEEGLIVPAPADAVRAVKLLYPVAVFPYRSNAVMVMVNAVFTVLGLVIVPNEKRSTDVGLTVIELLVSVFRAESSRTVIVCEPAVFSANPSKMCVPLSPLEKVYLFEEVNGKVAWASVDVKYTCPR